MYVVVNCYFYITFCDIYVVFISYALASGHCRWNVRLSVVTTISHKQLGQFLIKLTENIGLPSWPSG